MEVLSNDPNVNFFWPAYLVVALIIQFKCQMTSISKYPALANIYNAGQK